MGEDINNLGSGLWVLGGGEKVLTAKSAKKGAEAAEGFSVLGARDKCMPCLYRLLGMGTDFTDYH
jgi:hypothetical protein